MPSIRSVISPGTKQWNVSIQIGRTYEVDATFVAFVNISLKSILSTFGVRFLRYSASVNAVLNADDVDSDKRATYRRRRRHSEWQCDEFGSLKCFCSSASN